MNINHLRCSNTLFILFFLIFATSTNSSYLKSKSVKLKTCPAGQTLVANTNKKATANGCGPEGKNFKKLATDVAHVLIGMFTECCNTHDICYGTCHSSKSSCDDNFLTCMRQVCKKKKHVFNKKLCKGEAKATYEAVHKLGNDPFYTAQNDYCMCQAK